MTSQLRVVLGIRDGCQAARVRCWKDHRPHARGSASRMPSSSCSSWMAALCSARHHRFRGVPTRPARTDVAAHLGLRPGRCATTASVLTPVATTTRSARMSTTSSCWVGAPPPGRQVQETAHACLAQDPGSRLERLGQGVEVHAELGVPWATERGLAAPAAPRRIAAWDGCGLPSSAAAANASFPLSSITSIGPGRLQGVGRRRRGRARGAPDRPRPSPKSSRQRFVHHAARWAVAGARVARARRPPTARPIGRTTGRPTSANGRAGISRYRRCSSGRAGAWIATRRRPSDGPPRPRPHRGRRGPACERRTHHRHRSRRRPRRPDCCWPPAEGTTDIGASGRTGS